jgi:serine/threonine protein kinase
MFNLWEWSVAPPQMSHSNIVSYTESFVEGDKLYIVMEFAERGDLSNSIARKRQTMEAFTEPVRYLLRRV